MVNLAFVVAAPFGGGTTESNMHPLVLTAAIVVACAMILLPRRYALLPALAVIFLTPRQQLVLGGVHVSVVQILAVAGAARLLKSRFQSRELLFSGGFRPLDKLFLAWAIVHALAFIFLIRQMGAAVNQMGFLLDASLYFVCRYFIRDRDDVARILTALAYVAAALALCMSYEFVTRDNLFSHISLETITPWVRNGDVRAQGPFANSITAGVFGATLFPLFVWLMAKRRKSLPAWIGVTASTIIAIASVANTAILAYASGIMALCFWPIRQQMRKLRIGIACTVIGLALVMKAPVWYLLERINPIGGHSWDRAYLIATTVSHFQQWWLLGTTSNAEWGGSTWDTCNEFVTQATSGGVLLLCIFIAILVRAFGLIGKARKFAEGRREAWLYWCLGSALFVHFIAFWGVDYFDQVRNWWYVFLAIVPAAMTIASRKHRDRDGSPPDALSVPDKNHVTTAVAEPELATSSWRFQIGQ